MKMVIFLGSFPNNPASLFGHTFLRLSRGKKDLLDYSVVDEGLFARALPEYLYQVEFGFPRKLHGETIATTLNFGTIDKESGEVVDSENSPLSFSINAG